MFTRTTALQLAIDLFGHLVHEQNCFTLELLPAAQGNLVQYRTHIWMSEVLLAI